MQLTAKVLGEVRVVSDGDEVELGGSRLRRLLAALLVERGAVVSTDRLVEAVFGADPPDAAWRTFRTYVARLRRALDAAGVDGSDIIVTVPSGYRVPADLDLDAAEFERLLQRARRELHDGDAVGALRTVDAALDLWAGDAYGEFATEDWARPEAVRLDELRIVAQEVRVAAMMDGGRLDEAIADLGALVHAHPLREEPRRLLMVALYRCGRHAEALRSGRDFRSLLAEETGLDWSSVLAETEQMVLDRDPRLDRTPPGRQLRGYILRERIGESPFGATFRAEQPAVGRDVAVTVVDSELADDGEFIRRFETRAQRLAAIEHPNVVPLYDYWREPGGAYLVTRYLPGGTLAERLAEAELLGEDEAVTIIDDIGRALVAASERGVSHGRLTSDVVLLDRQGGAHLAGFGMDDRDGGRSDLDAFTELVEEILDHVRTPEPHPRRAGGHDEGARGGVADDGALDRVRGGPSAVVGRVRAISTRPESVVELVAETMAAIAGEPLDERELPRRSTPIEGPNPYRGLHAFRETDSGLFFGRTDVVEQLTADLRRDSVVALVGPSGAGKSSVARAGLLPRLRATGAYVATMSPGVHPLAELDIALARVSASPVPELGPVLERRHGLAEALATALPGDGARLVLLVDQLEEAVTMSDPAERDLVFAALDRARREGGGDIQLVATARADFLGRLLELPVVGPLVRDHSRLITPLDSEELYEAIVGPAATVGMAVEPELATALVADAIDAPGSLPLLQFALTELYERRVDGAMTLEEYRRMGGLIAPLTQRVEEVYAGLSTDEQAAARRLFTRLITVGEGSEDTRRRVPWSELSTVPDPVINAFGSARLLTFDRDPRTREPTVEVAHEALIRMWPRLRSWIDDDRAGLLTLRHLTAAAGSWDETGRDPSELYRGTRLATADDWARHHDAELTPIEREFLAASRAERERATERERRRAQRLRMLTVALAVIAVVAVVAGAVAVVQRSRANDQRALADANAEVAERRSAEADEQRALAVANADEAERQAQLADIQRLTAEAAAAVGDDPDLPILLGIEAYETTRAIGAEPSGDLVAALQTAVQSSRLVRSTDAIAGHAAFSRDGDLLVGASGSEIVVVEIGSGDELHRFDTGGEIISVTADRSGEQLAVVVGDDRVASAAGGEPEGSTVLVVDSADWGITERLEVPFRVEPGEGLSPDAAWFAAGDGDSVSVYDLRRVASVPIVLSGDLLGWMPDGRTVVLAERGESGESYVVRFVDARTSEEARAPMSVGPANGAALSPGGDRLVTGRWTHFDVWRIGAAEPERTFAWMNAQVWGQTRFSPDGRRLVEFGGINRTRVIDVVDGRELMLGGSPGGAEVPTFAADGTMLALVGTAGTDVYDISASGPAVPGNLPTSGVVESIRFTADGSAAIVNESDESSSITRHRVRAIELATGADRWSTPWLESDPPRASDDGLVATSFLDGRRGRVERVDGTGPTVTFDPCERPTAMDDQGRWLVLSARDFTSCLRPSTVIEATTGEVVHDFEDRGANWAMFGPSGTVAEGLLVTRTLTPVGSDLGAAVLTLEVIHIPSGEVLGSIVDPVGPEARDFWRPFFSADGRYATVGSDRSGAWVFDVAAMLDGATMGESVVANEQGRGTTATFPDVFGGLLVFGESGEDLYFDDLSTGATVMTLPVDTGRSTMLRATADGSALYYMGAGGVMRRLPADPAELVAIAEQRLQRDFTEAECLRFEIASDCSVYESSKGE